MLISVAYFKAAHRYALNRKTLRREKGGGSQTPICEQYRYKLTVEMHKNALEYIYESNYKRVAKKKGKK